ncbi:MAG: hypothetical protein WBV61_05750 [Rhodanobacteraceae bacterium]
MKAASFACIAFAAGLASSPMNAEESRTSASSSPLTYALGLGKIVGKPTAGWIV